jgi:DNA-directed RNA polymerase III subunit RPC3
MSRLQQEGDIDRTDRIRILLRDLLYLAYIKPSIPALHTSPRDRRISYEAESLRMQKKMLTPKERGNIAMEAGRRLEMDEKSVWVEEGKVNRRGLIPARKRRAVNGKGHKNKKSKAANGKSRSMNLVNSSDSEEEDERGNFDIDPGLFIRVNFDRFDVHIRDDIIHKAVEYRYNTTTADVLQAMMRMNIKISQEVPSTKDEQSAVLHIANIRNHLPPGIALKRAFDRESLRIALGSDPAQSSLLSEIVAILLGAGDISRAGLNRRLVTPGGSTNGTAISAGASQIPSQLLVQYGNAARVLREQLLRNVVEAQFGASGTRIMSLLRDMGKLEEKHISKLTLMPMGETRDVCSRLFASSLLSLQEVPKSSDRSAARTIFFWYVNEKKCISWLCDHLFKTLSRLSQRRRHELAREADVINKSQRIDIAQDHSLLADVELERLKKVQEKVAIVSLAEQRTWQDLFVVLQLPE